MHTTIPCVLMRAGTSRGPFFLKEWLPADPTARDEALIGAIGASDPLNLDGLGGGSSLNSKVAIVSRSSEPDCDLDYLFAQVGVGRHTVDLRPNCGNMLSGVLPFAIEQGLVAPGPQTTRARVRNVNTGARIDVTVRTPDGRLTYDGSARIDGVAGTGAPILLDFLDAWGSTTGKLFPTGQRVDVVDGIEVTCIDAAMPLMIVRAPDLGLGGREKPVALDANAALLARIERMRRIAGRLMGLGDVADSVVPKPVLVSQGDGPASIVSRYFTPHRCHASHAVTGAIGVATAFALPGTVANDRAFEPGRHALAILHPAGQIDVEVEIQGTADDARVNRASLVRTARKIMQGQLHLPAHVFSSSAAAAQPPSPRATATQAPVRLIVPTAAGGANDVIARALAPHMARQLGRPVRVDHRAGAGGAVASEFVARAPADGSTLLLGYVGTHAMHPALRDLRYDPVTDFEPIGLIGASPTLLVANPRTGVRDVGQLVAQLRRQPGRYVCATAGDGTATHFAAALFGLRTGTSLRILDHRGAAPAIAATANGLAHVMFPSLFTAEPLVRTGTLHALAVAGLHRLPQFPDLPTLAECGVEGVDVTQWYGLFAPKGTPRTVVDALNRALKEALAQPEVAGRLQAQGAALKAGTPAQLGNWVQGQLRHWTRVALEAGLREPAQVLEVSELG